MRRIFLFLMALVLPSAAHASLDIETAWGKNCSSPGSMAIRATNNYKYPIDMRLCLKRTTGKWSCFVSPNVEPGEMSPKSWGYYVCKATGDYFWSVRRAGAWSVKFDDPPGYNDQSSRTPARKPSAKTPPAKKKGGLDIKTAWDKNCSKPGSMAIKAVNNYSYATDIRLCLKRRTGKWSCFVSPDVASGATTPSNWGYYVCNADGEYFWSVRRAGAWHIKFDDPPGFQKN